MLRSYPLKTMSIEKAIEKQFALVDSIHRNFKGNEFLSQGDLGVVYGEYPIYTKKVERTLADFFNSPDAVLVRGAGTGAIRNYLSLHDFSDSKVLVHAAPIYSTTKIILEERNIKTKTLDYNKISDIPISDGFLNDVSLAIIQHSRQTLHDSYDLENVISNLKTIKPDLKILIDDNYTIMKTEKNGYELGGDGSCFSLFKLLGKEGIGCILCSKEEGKEIRKKAYSGGSKVQGFEAMECLRGLVYAPVALAIQSVETDKIVDAINKGLVKGATEAVRANAQSVVAIVLLDKPIAKKVIQLANEKGAAPYPVGAESRYEITSMFYRVSKTFIKDNPELEDYAIRINPMRSSSDTVLRILNEIIPLC